MSNGEDLDIMFEVDMQNYERNRMYPPGHEKERIMKKPVRKHVSAVRHAKQLLKTAAHRLPAGPTRDDLLEDVKLLTEVATMVHYQIVNPTLPFAVPDVQNIGNIRLGVKYYGPEDARRTD